MRSQKKWKKLIALTGSLAFSLWLGGLAGASVIDAPHNDTHAIQCTDCHAYSLWWQYSPAANSSTPYSQITDGVCNKCHGPGGSAPNKIGHSWESMADIHDPYLGAWQTKCVDCHNPHYQQQMNWLTADPALSANLYLATGTISAGTVQVTDNTTTFTYKNADAHSNWLNPALWSAKSNPGRGLILVLQDATQSTFEINAASETTPIVAGTANGAGTITLQGALATSYNAADTNFAIIYGQLLKKSIDTPNSGSKEVKFFDATLSYDQGLIGGPADPVTTPPQGICQVCHTQTKYYNEDGLTQPDRANPANPRIAAPPHNRSISCIPCHSPSLGFRPTNADHTFISNLGTTCANCHNQADIISGTHQGNCADCHTSPPTLIAGFPSSKWPTAVGQPRNTGTCYDCHSPIAAAFTAHPKALDHSGQVEPYLVGSVARCTGCHFHSNKDVVSDIHGADGSPCDTCHSLTYDGASGSYSGSGALISRAAQYGKGNCSTCHPEIASSFVSHPKALDHSGQVDVTPQCALCHSGSPVDDVHSWNCGNCHTAPTGLLKSLALSKGPGDCMHCHTDFSTHTNLDAGNHSASVTSTEACRECHYAVNSDLIGGVHGRNGCATCHDQYGALINSAAGHPLGGDCATCHALQAADLALLQHPAIDHTAMNQYVVGNPEGNCTSCHVGDPVEVVHNKNCTLCHLAMNTNDLHTLVGSAAGHSGHLQNTCTDCHTVFVSQGTRAGHFNGTKGTALQTRHMDYINEIAGQCIVCHTDSTVYPSRWLPDPFMSSRTHNGFCYTCHINEDDLTLKGSATGKGTGKPLTSIGCTGCHAKFAADPHQ